MKAHPAAEIFPLQKGAQTMVMSYPPQCDRQRHEQDLRAAADTWIEANPDIYEMFVRFANQMAGRGHPFSIGLLAERVRWECRFQFDRTDFKINNNHRAYIARRLVEEHPHLKERLRFRAVRY